MSDPGTFNGVVPSSAQFDIRMTLHNELIQNTIYARREAGWDAEVLLSVSEGLYQWASEQLMQNLSTDVVLREVYGVDLTVTNGPTATFAPAITQAGDINSPALPGSVCLCVSFRTPFRGRSFRGRNYVSGIVEADVTGNIVSQARRANIQAAYAGLNSYILPFSAFHVVVSRYAGGLPRVQGIATGVSAYVIVDPNVDSQRRRLAGRGR